MELVAVVVKMQLVQKELQLLVVMVALDLLALIPVHQ
jgi:hypothetical protein